MGVSTVMDEKTAFDLFQAGTEVTLVVDGRREEGVFITGLQLPAGTMDLSLRTPIGQPGRRVRIHRQRVERAE